MAGQRLQMQAALHGVLFDGFLKAKNSEMFSKKIGELKEWISASQFYAKENYEANS